MSLMVLALVSAVNVQMSDSSFCVAILCVLQGHNKSVHCIAVHKNDGPATIYSASHDGLINILLFVFTIAFSGSLYLCRVQTTQDLPDSAVAGHRIVYGFKGQMLAKNSRHFSNPVSTAVRVKLV